MFSRIKQFFAPRPPREFQHPAFGRFEADHDIWTTTLERDGVRFELSLAGSETAPGEGLALVAPALLARFNELRDAALAFITTQEKRARPEDFTILGLDLLWEDRPNDFTLTFTMKGDDDGIWRVEFQSGAPRFLGRDD